MNELDYTRILQIPRKKKITNKQQKKHQYIDKFNATEHNKKRKYFVSDITLREYDFQNYLYNQKIEAWPDR